MTRRAARVVAAVGLAASLGAGLIGCAAPSPETTATAAASARPVTTEEAQLLAIARYNNFDRGSRAFATEVDDEGATLALRGWVDYADALGYAAATGGASPDGVSPDGVSPDGVSPDGAPADGVSPDSASEESASPDNASEAPAAETGSIEALLWNDATVARIPATPDAAGDPPLPVPALDTGGWRSTALDPTGYRLDALLAGISSLGADRPDNPLLVQQSGALWLRADEVDGEPVTVFAAPPDDDAAPASGLDADTSPLRLWVDARGLMLRAELRLGDRWHTVDLPDREAPRLEVTTR